MKNVYEVIRRPLITEKTTALKETQRSLCFEVHRDASKPEIKKAVDADAMKRELGAGGTTAKIPNPIPEAATPIATPL